MNCDSQSGPYSPDITGRDTLNGSEPAIMMNQQASSEIGSGLQPSFYDSGLGSSETFPVYMSGFVSRYQSAPSPVPPTFHKSEVGTSRPYMPALALPSLLSAPFEFPFSMFTPAGNRPTLPQMPKDCGSKIGFSCPICSHSQMPITTHRQWR